MKSKEEWVKIIWGKFCISDQYIRLVGVIQNDAAHTARKEALEEAAKIIEDNAEGFDNSGRIILPRIEYNQSGLGYAQAIRALIDKGAE